LEVLPARVHAVPPSPGIPSKEKVLRALGDAVKSMRLRKHSSAEAFAQRADLDRAYYGHIERGANITFTTLVKLCLALQIRPSDLMRRVEDELPAGYWKKPKRPDG
jgi:transcriptional regulator with XRE-family HTH domain